MLKDSASAPSTKIEVMRAPMPKRRQNGGRPAVGTAVGSATSGHQLVAHAPHREYVPRQGRVRLDFGPQASDVHVHQATVAEVVVAPHPVQELLTAQYLVRTGGQLAEQPELGPSAVHLLAVEVAQDALFGQQLQRAEGERTRVVLLGWAGSSQQSADAG